MRVCKVLLALLLIPVFLFTGSPSRACAEGEPVISAKRAVLIFADGTVLYEKNSRERSRIASTTKLMTALLVAEHNQLQEKICVPASCCGIEGSSVYLCPDRVYTVQELLEGLLLASGNDAAQALAQHTAGSISNFVSWMNTRARALGMADSHFENPHGLDAENHYSTAMDLAILMAKCMENRDLARIFALTSCQVGDSVFSNHNKLLPLCAGCVGGKTGYTASAGRCLVSCCERNGARLICVTLSAPNDWEDHQKLYDWAYSNYTLQDVAQTFRLEVPVVSGTQSTAAICVPPTPLFLKNGTEIEWRLDVPLFVFAPLKKGEEAGTMTLYYGKEQRKRIPILFSESVAEN